MFAQAVVKANARSSDTVYFKRGDTFYSTIIPVAGNMQGRQVQKNMVAAVQGNNQAVINIASLAVGKYVVTLQNSGEVRQGGFVKAP